MKSAAVEGLAQIFAGLVESVISMWRGRASLSGSSLFEDPALKRRSQIASTVVCIIATMVLLCVMAGMAWLVWWMCTRMFTLHDRR